MEGKMDLILVSKSGERNIVTMNSRNSVEEALAIKGDKIGFVGSTSKAMELKGPRTQVIELSDRTVMPGFVDAHMHFVTIGTNMLGINLKAPDVRSIEDIKRKVKEQAFAAPCDKWIRGWGYDHSKLMEKRHPTRQDLDEVSPEKPVILTRTCGHIAVVNSKALELAGINDQVQDPPGGRFGRSDGKLNGILYESAQDRLLKISGYNLQEYKQGVKLAAQELLKWGITSVHDEGLNGGQLGIRALVEETFGDLPLRIYLAASCILGDKTGDYFLETGLITGFGNEKLRLGAYKVMVDGSSSGPTCATRDPYTSDSNNYGMLYHSQEELDVLVEKAHAKGFQVSAHCVGDRAIEMMLNAIEKTFKRYPRESARGLRPRIEHCAICPPDLVKRIKKLGVVPVIQPIWFHEFGDGYLQNYGTKRVEYMFPFKNFTENDIVFAMSTDSPVTTYNPFLNIYEAMARKTMNGQLCGQTEAATEIIDVLKAYTFGGSYASFQEDKLGSLEVGKLADVIVLSDNVLRKPAREVVETEVDVTIVGGKVVYQRN